MQIQVGNSLSDGKTLILYSLFIADGLLSFEPLLVVCFYHLLIFLLVLVPPHINHMMLVVTRGRKVIPPNHSLDYSLVCLDCLPPRPPNHLGPAWLTGLANAHQQHIATCPHALSPLFIHQRFLRANTNII